MDSLAWRYHPEFRIQVQIDNQPVSTGIHLVAHRFGTSAIENYGVLTRTHESTIVCFQRQRRSGVTWVPAADIVSPQRFGFSVFIQFDTIPASLAFFADSNVRFGRPILYADNLNAAGNIDANLAGDVVSLTSGVAAGDTERASVSLPALTARVNAAEFTQVEAGQIRPGSAVTFDNSVPINSTQTTAKLDLLEEPTGPYQVQLVGPTPVEEVVYVEGQLSGGAAQGFIDIYRDSWLTPAVPREYLLNFASA